MLHTDERITIVDDDQSVRNIQRAAGVVIQGSIQGGLRIHKIDEWIAVPVESGLHFDESDKLRLSQVIETHGDLLIYGFALESSPSIPAVISFNTNYEGFDAFNDAFSLYNYALFPETMSWMLLCLTEDYYVVLGPLPFIEQALGTSTEEGYALFYNFANNPGWPPSVRERFLYVLQTFKEQYHKTKPGSYIVL
jgi:hypothetical protein